MVGLSQLTRLHFHWSQQKTSWTDIFLALMKIANMTQLKDVSIRCPYNADDGNETDISNILVRGVHRKSRRFAGALTRLTGLQTLEMEGCPLTTLGADTLAQTVSQLRQLKTVRLRRCLLRQNCPAPSLGQVIRTHLPDGAQLVNDDHTVCHAAHTHSHKNCNMGSICVVTCRSTSQVFRPSRPCMRTTQMILMKMMTAAMTIS